MPDSSSPTPHPPDDPSPDESSTNEAAAEASPATSSSAASRKSKASTIAGGILTSRVVGLMREQVLAYFLGVSAYMDVYQAAIKVPNLLQNLLGEGTLSASFIPIYSRMIEEGREEEAGRFAGAVFGLLLALVAVATILGVVLARPLTMLVAGGFLLDDGAASGAAAIDRFELTMQAIRITFPATALLVLAAWALGVLNSHRRFFLPYFAPVLFNVSIIAALGAAAYAYGGDLRLPAGSTAFPGPLQYDLLWGALYGTLAGGLLQFLVQLPLVTRVTKGLRFSLSTRVAGVREALRAFGPVVLGRGVYQISAYLDNLLGTLLKVGALSALRYSTLLYTLPVSLFGLSIAASELPELSRLRSDAVRTFLRRMDRSMSQMLFLIIPTSVGYLGLGYLIVGAVFQRGQFGVSDTWLVYLLLCAYSIGLLATSAARLLQNAFYALGDTRTPAKIAVLRLGASTLVALPVMFLLDDFRLEDLVGYAAGPQTLHLGALGLAFGSATGAWVELWRLLEALRDRKIPFTMPWKRVAQMIGLATAALAVAALVWYLLPGWPLLVNALLVVGCYGVAYLAIAWQLGFSEINAWLGRYLHRLS